MQNVLVEAHKKRGPVREVLIIPYTYNYEVIYILYPKLQTHLNLKSLC